MEGLMEDIRGASLLVAQDGFTQTSAESNHNGLHLGETRGVVERVDPDQNIYMFGIQTQGLRYLNQG